MNVFALTAKLLFDKSDYEKGLNEASKEGSSFGSSIGGAVGKGLKTVAEVGVKALAGATTAVVGFEATAIKTGMEFDKSMSQVEATMGDSAHKMVEYNGETVDSMEALRDFAQQMGATTAFSASESAEALNYMALAGYDATQAMEMLPTVLNLASAGNIDLAYASDMVTDAQSALGLSAEETTEMVDKMAKASSKSNTSVAQLGEAFLTVGGTAQMLSGGTTELSTALGLLADNGIKGSEGGTALRNIMLSLTAPTDKASEAIESLGLQVYDAEGKMRPMEDIFTDLNSSLEDMNDGQKVNALNNIFNKVDLKSVNALLNTNVDRWEELSEAIDDSAGSAETMANVQLDNLSGDITLLKSAFEGFQIAVSEGATGGVRDFVQFASSSLSTLTEAYKEEGLQGAMSAMGDILTNGLNMVIEYIPQALDAGVQLLTAVIQGLIDNSSLIIDSAVKIVEMLYNGLVENLPKIADGAFDIVKKLISTITENAPKIYEGAYSLIQSLCESIASMLPELIPQALEMVLTLAESLIDNVDKLVDGAIALVVGLSDGIINALPILIEKAPTIIVKLVTALCKAVPKLWQASLKMVEAIWTGIVQNLPTLIKKIPEIWTKCVEALKDGFGDIVDVGKEFIENLWNGIADKIEWIKDKIKGFGETVVNSIKSIFGLGGGDTGTDKFVFGIDSTSDTFTPVISRTVIATNNTITKAIQDLQKSMYSDMRDALADGLTWEWDDRTLGRMVRNYA